MKTYTATPAEIERNWHVIDAAGLPLGRLATQVAMLLRGKHKPIYSPHLDTGDFVVILNASKVAFTGQKPTQKVYYHHSMHPGGLKAVRLKEMLAKHPERVIEKAVKGMLPKGALGKQIFSKLKVYAGDEHPHIAQVNAGAAKARRAERAEAAPAPKPAVKAAPAAKAAPEPATPAAPESAAPERATSSAPAETTDSPAATPAPVETASGPAVESPEVTPASGEDKEA